MTAEAATLEARAAEAWAMMVRARKPMPAAVALDYVQDVCDDREECRRRLHANASTWLCDQLTKRGWGRWGANPAYDLTKLFDGETTSLRGFVTRTQIDCRDVLNMGNLVYYEYERAAARSRLTWTFKALAVCELVEQLRATP